MRSLLVGLLAGFVPVTGVVAQGIKVPVAAKAPVLDGRVAKNEYAAPTVRIAVPLGEVQVSMTRHGGYLYIAAVLPDTSMYWGDDFVVSFDANGSGGAAPDVGDRQWYLRRVLDSSVVFVVDAAAKGRWNPDGVTPKLLGGKRHDDVWDVAASSTATGWSVELRIRESLFSAGHPPRVSFRTYNDKPRGWFTFPQALDGKPLSVERVPLQWVALRF